MDTSTQPKTYNIFTPKKEVIDKNSDSQYPLKNKSPLKNNIGLVCQHDGKNSIFFKLSTQNETTKSISKNP